jgi:transcriptional regulator with XRE-family HTH domain
VAADRSALGAFLRSRRDRLTPARAGVTAFPGARRVPGLRREELAVLAGLSPDYYGRLEQGRQRHVSDAVLEALARALRLDPVEHAHLRELAAPAGRRRRVRPEVPQRPDPGLLRLAATLDHVPVLLLGRRTEVLADNALLRAVLGRRFRPGTLLARYLFRDPLARERLVNWADFAPATMAVLRREAGLHPDDRALAALVDELRAADPEAARWWDDHAVRDHSSLVKRVLHSVAGPLTFGIEVVTAPHEPDQTLVVYTVEPDSPTARVLPLLASWSVPAGRGTP